MRASNKLILALSFVALLAGCSCKTKHPGEGEVAGPSTDGPLKDINFAFDSYKLDSKAKDILNANAAWLKSNADSQAQVEGHCDQRGGIQYNVALGEKRANSVKKALEGAGNWLVATPTA